MEERKTSTRKWGKYVVVSTVLVTLIVLLIVLGNQSKAGAENEKNNVEQQLEQEEMLGEINGIMESLAQMDTVLKENQMSLENIEGYRDNVDIRFVELSKSIEQVEKQIRGYQNVTTEENKELDIKLENLANELKHIQESILSSRTELLSVLNNMEEKEKDGREYMEKNFEGLRQSIKDNREQLIKFTKEIAVLLEQIQNEQDEQYQEVIRLLLESEERLSEVTENGMATLLEHMDGQFYDMQIQMENNMVELSEKLAGIRVQIAGTQGELEQLLLDVKNDQAENQKETMETFTSIQNSMNQIYTGFNSAHEEIRELITDLKETTVAGQKELLIVLGEMESGMQESGSENLNQILTNMDEMAVQYDNSFNVLKQEMNQNVSNVGNNVENRLDILETNLRNQNTNLTNVVNQGDEGLRDYISSAFGAVSQRLDSVFQSVSDGKKKLASALLTKGINCKEDATFEEITDAILAIPQELVIGESQIPGTITYEYHYHKDQNGNVQHVEHLAQSGGCYTVPIYHVHTGDSRNGGGCYMVPIIHNHTSSCYETIKKVRQVTGFWFTGQGTGHPCCDNAHGQNYAKYRYTEKVYVNGVLTSSKDGEGDLGYSCGLCVERKAYSHEENSTINNLICGYSEGLNGYQLGCGKDEHTVEAYRTGCGLGDGQIIGAHIVYKNGAAMMSSSAIDIPMETIQEVESTIQEPEKIPEQSEVPEDETTAPYGSEKEEITGNQGEVMAEEQEEAGQEIVTEFQSN